MQRLNMHQGMYQAVTRAVQVRYLPLRASTFLKQRLLRCLLSAHCSRHITGASS